MVKLIFKNYQSTRKVETRFTRSLQNVFNFYWYITVEWVFKYDFRYKYSWNPVGQQSMLITGGLSCDFRLIIISVSWTLSCTFLSHVQEEKNLFSPMLPCSVINTLSNLFWLCFDIISQLHCSGFLAFYLWGIQPSLNLVWKTLAISHWINLALP